MLAGFHKIIILINKNSPNFLLNMFHLEPTPLSLNKKKKKIDNSNNKLSYLGVHANNLCPVKYVT